MFIRKVKVLPVFLVITLISNKSTQQELKSPCPDVFIINPTSIDVGTWSGTLRPKLSSDIVGLFVALELDSKINLITNNFGLMSTKNNQQYLFEDFAFSIAENNKDLVFTIKYNGADPAPQITKVFINGVQKCPEKKPKPRRPRVGSKPKQRYDPSLIQPRIEVDEITTTTTTDMARTENPEMITFTRIPFIDVEEE